MKAYFSSFTITIAIALLHLTLPLSLSQRCNVKDEKALLRIKKSLGNPYVLASWTRNIDCCKWNYVDCDLYNDRINSLTIFSAGSISATIPDAIGDLPYLQTLIFHRLNNLTGQIPATLTKLTLLRTLTISRTGVSGAIPSFISQLKSLITLDLSYNNFNGSIPPELAMLPNLETLHLDRNRLSGPIPESFGTFTKVPAIYLSHNMLNGTVPKSLAQVNFTLLDLSRNRLQGDLWVLFGTNKTIQSADFSRNMFEFNFTNMKEFPRSLSGLDLNHNRIYGSLPETLAGLELQTLNVSYNKLCGEIPAGGWLQKYDNTAYFHNRCLCGSPLPAC